MDLLKRQAPGRVFGTCMGESNSNRAVFERRLQRSNLTEIGSFWNTSCGDFIKDYALEMLDKEG